MTREFRTYHEVAGDDRSQLGAQVARQRERVRERLAGVRCVVAVMSGKGGVGKSYVTAALARGLAPRCTAGVGVLDADLHGPTAARLLDATGPVPLEVGGARPAQGAGGVKVFSTDLLLADGQPLRWREPEGDRFVWRGALETGTLREFLSDVAWGTLDLLLVDLPPGTAHLSDLGTFVPDLAGAVAVTIPSEESRRSVARAMQAARDVPIRLLGVMENMSGYACPGCGETRRLFPGDAGTALARAFGVPLLGTVPFHRAARADPNAVGEGVATPAPALPTAVIDALLEVLP